MNSVQLVGRLAADPELRSTQQGTSVASLRLAVNRNYTGPDGQKQADFINVVCWRQTADFVNKYFRKGSPIAIEGSIQTRQYQDKNGNNRTTVEVVARQANFVPAPAGYKPNAAQSGAAPADSAVPEQWGQGAEDAFVPVAGDDDLPF